MMSYPPASNLMAVHGSCEDEAVLAQAMEYIRRYLIRIGGENLFIIGPASEPLARKKDRYQMVLYIKEADPQALIRLREKLEQYIEINKGFQKIYIQFDLNA